MIGRVADISLVGASVHFSNFAHTAQNGGGDAFIVRGCISTTEHLAIDLVGAIAQCRVVWIRHDEIDGIHRTIYVGAAIHLIDEAGIDRGVGRAEDVGSSAGFAVAATNDAVDAAAFYI